VLGVWDESLLAKNAVIPQEFLNRLFLLQKNPVRTVEGIDIYYEFIPGHRYQLGIDVAEGSEEETEKKDKKGEKSWRDFILELVKYKKKIAGGEKT